MMITALEGRLKYTDDCLQRRRFTMSFLAYKIILDPDRYLSVSMDIYQASPSHELKRSWYGYLRMHETRSTVEYWFQVCNAINQNTVTLKISLLLTFDVLFSENDM
ncbi:hypothetical protein NPIL_8861 [Nephila pilipes]|uniref:Uncharacterized protein n=1 Tax=Nephila pilipes TaxID=299642 RepID=A0A8X6UT66_NEPPI|nr:hypothetical protein NPIL_8861 [Nephila pilipes]